MHDPLTGLPNRALFTRRLSVALENLGNDTWSVAVVVFDLDRFNAINDAMGHDAGDDVLVSVASRLRLAGGSFRPLMSRLGGDEFLALFEHPGHLAGEIAEAFAERALLALEDPFDIGGNEIFISASVGDRRDRRPRDGGLDALVERRRRHAREQVGRRGRQARSSEMPCAGTWSSGSPRSTRSTGPSTGAS